ncbi:hydrolase [Clostridium sporogenes]|uniref:CPCC family cysteine-rich protein n=1 Tax=Clostridium TaxID=1485 RepID=UPI002237FD9D|nr:CPCC family cysteine-rich protein [Clostridium sporogenes]MCW6111097.1 hydrolase [Clostridium sporogenes]HDK7166210.1 hydrolase [Clostridium botulinum]
MNKYECVCCGNFTLSECPPGTYEICPICNWEDDEYQYNNPDYAGGANDLSLNEARKQYFKNEHNRKNYDI